MRTNGVPERFCTGDASDWEKFEAWAARVPDTLRNPLYHWTHLELRRPFGIEALLSPATAREIYDRATAQLRQPAFSTLGLLSGIPRAVVCTTDDPTDSLEHHEALARRPDPGHARVPDLAPRQGARRGRPRGARRLHRTARAGERPRGHGPLVDLEALDARHQASTRWAAAPPTTASRRCTPSPGRTAWWRPPSTTRAPANRLEPGDALRVKSALLHDLALMDHARGWVQQFHLGALRNNNTRLRRTLGPRHRLRLHRRLRAGAAARALPRPPGQRRPPRAHDPLQLESARQRAHGHHDRQLPGRLDAREDAVRQRLVVPRPARRHGTADRRALEPGPALAVRRHGDRLAQLSLVLAPRVLPAPALQHARRGRGQGPRAERPRAARRLVRHVCFENARDYFGQPMGTAANQ